MEIRSKSEELTKELHRNLIVLPSVTDLEFMKWWGGGEAFVSKFPLKFCSF